MCGIFAYLGDKKADNYLVNGLKNLEYRGYDSAGIVCFNDSSDIYLKKAIGRVSNLGEEIYKENKNLEGFNVGIAHTRWATHGKVTINNTHPHFSNNNRFYIVHNGIIENFIELKKMLESKGFKFYSDTDSEVVANLLEYYFEKDIETTIKKILEYITGAYAIVAIDKEEPKKLVGIKIGSPMVLGFSAGEYFISSDINAIANVTESYIPLEDREMVIVTPEEYKIFSNTKEVEKKVYKTMKNEELNELGSFDHFMQKEIFEVPEVIENAIAGRINFNTYEIKSNSLDKIPLEDIQRITIIASGTSYNAGFIGKYLFEEYAGIETNVEISTEFKYKRNFINKNTLYVFISQSGETADSLECLKFVKNKGGITFGIVNVVGSSIARMCDLGLYTHSGVEVGVAATKSFIGQLMAIITMTLDFGNKKDLDYIKYKEMIDDVKTLKDSVSLVLLNNKKVEKIARKYAKYKNMFFLGRNMYFPLAMEGSLKCKEITYNHTESYSAGELKHGPLSLIEPNFPTILLNPNSKLYSKNISTLKEITARNGKVVGIISSNDKNKDLYTDYIEIPESNSDIVNLINISVILQLFSYYAASELDREIDKPRNLAKSVTVE